MGREQHPGIKRSSKEKGAEAPLGDLIEVHQNHLNHRGAVAQPGSRAQDAVLECAFPFVDPRQSPGSGRPLLRSPQPNEETS
jgi:hypothetical protein